jgi:phage N-6-adenine-methyltransferase
MTTLGGEAQVGATDVWLTPPWILETLGEFDLDPCASIDRPWDTAKKHYTKEDNGLIQPWVGRIWCNPPYGRAMYPFLEKMVAHGNGIVLIFARTETKAFFEYVWDQADAIFFFKGRLRFYTPDGVEADTSGAPSVLVAYGSNNVKALEDSGLPGKLIYLK